MTKPILDRLMDAIEQVVIEYKREKKQINALHSVQKAKENGNQVGRKKVRDDSLIWRLRKEGMTIRSIAKQTGVSSASVQRSLDELEET